MKKIKIKILFYINWIINRNPTFVPLKTTPPTISTKKTFSTSSTLTKNKNNSNNLTSGNSNKNKNKSTNLSTFQDHK